MQKLSKVKEIFSLHYNAIVCIKKAHTHSLNTALMDLLNKRDGKHEFAVNMDMKARLQVSIVVSIFLIYSA